MKKLFLAVVFLALTALPCLAVNVTASELYADCTSTKKAKVQFCEGFVSAWAQSVDSLVIVLPQGVFGIAVSQDASIDQIKVAFMRFMQSDPRAEARGFGNRPADLILMLALSKAGGASLTRLDGEGAAIPGARPL